MTGRVSMLVADVEATYTRADWRETHRLDHRTPQLLTMFCGKLLDVDSIERHPQGKGACTVCDDRHKAAGR